MCAGQKKGSLLWRFSTEKKGKAGVKGFIVNFKKAPFALAIACLFTHIMLVFLFAYFKGSVNSFL